MSEPTILYIEDNEYNRKIVRQLLSRTAHRLIEAVDGESGVAQAQRGVARSGIPDRHGSCPRSRGLDATTRIYEGGPRQTHPDHR